MASNHMNDDDHFISNATAISTHLQPLPTVKFEMQVQLSFFPSSFSFNIVVVC